MRSSAAYPVKKVHGADESPCTKQGVRNPTAQISFRFGCLLVVLGSRGILGGGRDLLDGFGAYDLTFEGPPWSMGTLLGIACKLLLHRGSSFRIVAI